MRKKGLEEEELFHRIDQYSAKDFSFSSGRILGSFCSIPSPLAAEAISRYLEKNIGDSGLCPGTLELERDTIRILGNLLSCPEAVGNIVTGGTEANLIAMWAAKKKAKPHQREVILLESAHYSFDKAASMMDLTLVKIPVNDQFCISVDKIEKKLGKNTMAIVGVAGSTGLGVVDDISALSDLALQNEVYLHVDAAFGGYVLPFLEDAGYPTYPFDFRNSGVSSITLDPHKMGRSAIPSGAILFRNHELHQYAQTEVGYLAGGEIKQPTIVGTRSGASVAAVWAVLNGLGKDGFVSEVRYCMDVTKWLKAQIEHMPEVSVVTDPVLNVLGITSEHMPLAELAKKIRNKNWAISLFPHFLRIACMPHLTKETLTSFLKDLGDIINGE